MNAPQLEVYQQALAQYPESAQIRGQFAEFLLSLNKGGEAVEMARSAVDLDPNYAVGWLILGTALKAQHQFEDAINAFLKIVSLVPGHAPTHLSLGNCYAELDLLVEAELHLRHAILLEPGLKEAHASLGSVYIRQNRPELAEEPSRRALEIDPDMIAAHQNLAGLLVKSNPAEAKQHRDWAYRHQQIFVEASPGAAYNCLMLTTTGSGNIPYRHLLPKDRYQITKWYIEYAPEGQAASLPPYDFVFNGIGDPDLSGPTDEPVRSFVATCPAPVINDPEKIPPTRRSNLPKLLANIPGVFVPPVVRLEGKVEDLDARLRAAAVSFPVIARGTGSHGGDGLTRLQSARDVETYLARFEAAYVTQYIDYAGQDGWYRKYRAIFVDRTPYPFHLAIARDWLVHYGSSEMDQDPARRLEEQRFLTDPEKAIGTTAWAALQTIAQRLDLDYAGIDFSIMPDGRLLVFEANATMLVHPEENPLFLYKNPAVNRILDAFQAMIESRVAASRSETRQAVNG